MQKRAPFFDSARVVVKGKRGTNNPGIRRRSRGGNKGKENVVNKVSPRALIENLVPSVPEAEALYPVVVKFSSDRLKQRDRKRRTGKG
jgi:hypothetical protein